MELNISEKFSNAQNIFQYKVVQSIASYPETKGQGDNLRVLDTFINLKWLLDKFNADIRYNLMTRKREIHFPNLEIAAEDEENSALALVNYLATINGFPISQLDAHLDVIAHKNPFHPIVHMVKTNPWDGIARLDDFIAALECTDPVLANKVLKVWMVAAMAAAHSQNGFINNGVLVLQGSQGIGKTRWVKSLDPINCGAIKEGAF